MDLIDLKSLYTIFHIFGAIIGAGGAYMSDAMFFSSIKDKVISKKELHFLKIGSMFVWIGLILSIISGFLIFMTDPAFYLESSKFLIKVFIVFMILINGLFFHIEHLPLLHRHSDHHYPSSDEFTRKKKTLIISGVVSVTSWTFAIILGSINSIPIDFVTALLVYLSFEFISIIFVLIWFRKII
jgi:ABC-type xylose transport system permease subunit